MIESVTLYGTATFETPQRLERLSRINLVFGSNGTGKTTISRVINNDDGFDKCELHWSNGISLETLVYNRDFIEKHFDQSSELPGVFTLGDESIEIQQKITKLKKELEQLDDKIANRKRQLAGDHEQKGKLTELEKLEDQLTDDCWKQKLKHDDYFKDALEGYRNNKTKFRDKVLKVWAEKPTTTKSLEELKSDAETVFGEAPASVRLIALIDAIQFCEYEEHYLLSKPIRGKEDVSLAELINDLDHSDWVRQGVKYHEQADGRCPFCQRDTDENFVTALGAYFDETFEKEKKAIEALCVEYTDAASRVSEALNKISQEPHQFLNAETLEIRIKSLKTQVDLNIERLENKRKAPSTSIELEPIEDLVAEINEQLETANQVANDHNNKIANLTQEQRLLTKRVWQYIVHDELQSVLETYETKLGDLNKAINNINNQIIKLNSQKYDLDREIRNLEGQITGTKETLESINDLLERFDFITFKLAQVNNNRGYRLVRHDGSDASSTLSEGEKTFVTFLYFYNLLNGSLTKDGVTNSRIVVFDDPVSSLDSNVLFIVSTLIRGLFDDVTIGNGSIKQIFILTHNTYFHKEVTFQQDKSISYYVVRKFQDGSKVEYKKTNPIKTTYELLWAEIRSENRSTLTIRNTMRRILEYYFGYLGQTSFNDICDKFDGADKAVFQSLISWIHDGSHGVHGDPHFTISDEQVIHYLSVFRKVFKMKGQFEHYKMMMPDEVAYDDSAQLEPVSEPLTAERVENAI